MGKSVVLTRGGGVLKYISYTGMCRPIGSFFHKKSLDIGPLFTGKTLRYGSIFPKCSKFWVFAIQNFLNLRKIRRNGYLFWRKCPLEKGKGFETRAAHPCPNQIRVHPPPPGFICILRMLWTSHSYIIPFLGKNTIGFIQFYEKRQKYSPLERSNFDPNMLFVRWCFSRCRPPTYLTNFQLILILHLQETSGFMGCTNLKNLLTRK